MTLCWLARMKLRGFELNEHEDMTLENEISRLLKVVNKPEEVKKEVDVSNRPNIQDILREKAKDAAGELEAVFDEFITEGKTKTKTMELVSKFNVMPQHISLIADIWKKKQTEFSDLQEGTDKQLIEGYSHLTKIQVRNIVKFIEQMLSDLNSYISVKKASKAPRQRKAVPVEKIVSKLKYLKTFKDVATKIDLISISPVKLHGASEAWVYDTAKRKVHHYIADDYSKAFTVKGNTLLGFDSTKSEVKTLRKPAEQLKELMGSKPAARKFFNDIKAVSTTPNGRFNESMIILKAF
jgi:RecG-like helicase